MTKKQIVIDYGEHLDFCKRHEFFVANKEEMIDLAIEKGATAAAIAAIVSREEGLAPENILRDNPRLLLDGGSQSVHLILSNIRVVKEHEGKRHLVRLVNTAPARCIKPEEDDVDETSDENETIVEIVEYQVTSMDEPHYAEVGTQKNLDNAIRQLETIVMGHIRNRLTEVYFSGGDVEDQADSLKQRIDEVVATLLESQSTDVVMLEERAKVAV